MTVTPRPWRDAQTMGAIVADDPGSRLHADTIAFYGGAVVCESAEKDDRDLIVRAVNEYDALVAVADVARSLELGRTRDDGWPCIGNLAPLGELIDALARLDAIRAAQ